MDKEIYLYIVIGIILITSTIVITNRIDENRSNTAYTKLEDRLIDIEQSNTKLRIENQQLIDSNKQIRELQLRDAELISSGRDIIRDFQAGIGDSYSTIDRIEKGLETLERLIDVIFTEGEEVANDITGVSGSSSN